MALVLVAGALFACVMHWPLPAHLGSTVPKDLGDPLAQAWQPAWDGYALGHQPLEFFQSNQFWPNDDTLAFSDALIGYSPAGLVGDGPGAAIVRYNLLFLFCYALAFAGAYLLARELGLRPAGALVAGVAFAYAPFRLAQDGHLHVISSGGIPVALALGLRGYRLERPGWVLGGFAAAIWQLTIGFSLGLPMAYGLALLGLIALVFWLRRGHPSLPRPLVVATVVGSLAFVAAAFFLSRPYERVAEDHPQANRTPEAVQEFSGPLKTLLLTPAENELWGGVEDKLSEGVLNPHEKTLFPGLVIGALALMGVLAGPFPRKLRIGLGIGVIGIAILALGFQADDGYLWPYRAVYDFLPGWEGIRTPGRLATFSTLGLALLAGAGASRLPALRDSRWAIAATGVLALAIAVEGRGVPFDPFDAQAQPATPVAPSSVADVPAPQLHLPAERADDNRRYLLWSTDGFPDIVNGRSSVQPVETTTLVESMAGFPSEDTVSELRDFGVRSVVLHTDRVAATAQATAEFRSIEGLGIERSRRGDLVIYEIRDGSATSEP